MTINTFAAIDVGSFELSMKIYEVSRQNGMKQIDYLRHAIDMGTETYNTGLLSSERVEELCDILKEFAKVMKSYRVSEYKAYGTSAIRETKNTAILLDQIKQKTGITLEVISNSEQRFLDYKSIAFQGAKFDEVIKKNTAVLDIGGASIQMSLFEKNTLISTQNMKLGVLRIQDRMNTLDVSLRRYEDLVGELCSSQISTYEKLYLQGIKIENIIIVDDYLSLIIHKNINGRQVKDTADADYVNQCVEMIRNVNKVELAKIMGVPEETIPLLYISILLLQLVMKTTGAKKVWAPGVTLCDGIAYEYAESKGILRANHNFDDDIRACALQISKRYNGSRKRAETIENIALGVFDSIRKIGGLTPRDRLLLQISAILHDCGKYVSLLNLAECSYNIIKFTEIIGISHKERILIANIVKYNQKAFDYYDDFEDVDHLNPEDHMRLAKLTAILRIANGLDRSHKTKFKDFDISIENDKLIITVITDEDITLEKGLFSNRANFFREIYNLEPVIKQKRSI